MDADEPLHFRPAENGLGEPVIAIHHSSLGVCVEYAVRYREPRAKREPTLAELVASMTADFDAMAAAKRAEAVIYCVENVRRGQTVTQCSRKATRGLYCAQHSPFATTDDFESAPAGLDDVPDDLPFAS